MEEGRRGEPGEEGGVRSWRVMGKSEEACKEAGIPYNI